MYWEKNKNMALVLQEYIHYSYHLIRNALYIPQQSATASHQLLPRSQQEKKNTVKEVFQHYIHQKNQDSIIQCNMK